MNTLKEKLKKPLKKLMNLAKQIEIMKRREEEIEKLLEFLSQKSNGFTKPKLILIGGYALRAFVPFSRYTRDCDFALRKGKEWFIDKIRGWLSKITVVESFEKRDDYGFLRCVKFFGEKKPVKASFDFMEGKVVGRDETRQVVNIDEKFIDRSEKVSLTIAAKSLEFFVPSYTDYMILKVVSGRSSDIRDIATMIWKNKLPRAIQQRVRELLPNPNIFQDNIRETIIPTISNKRFMDSWKGMFLTSEFTEKNKKTVLNQLRSLLR